jgi:hypothetical protein
VTATAPNLYDADTAEPIGLATTEQVMASTDAAVRNGGSGIIRIDRTTGLVSSDGRRVYTDPAPASDLDAANGRWLTAGELRAHLECFPDDMPVTVADPRGSDWFNVIGATDPYESGEQSIVLTTRDDFDTRQF